MQDTSQPNHKDLTIEKLTSTVGELTKRNELLERLVQDLQETVKKLQDEISRLKKQKIRPNIPPSSLGNSKGGNDKNGKNRSSCPSSNTEVNNKKIKHQEVVIHPDHVPEGSRFKGYSDFHVEDLNIETIKTKYRLAVFITPEGNIIRGKLPPCLDGKHFGPELIAYCLDQYYARGVTRPQLLEQLLGFGVTISSGELDNILIINKDVFHKEKAAIFEAGKKYSDYLNTDDTGARHQGKNGYCTHVGSPLFSYFESTSSKSRINFLEILRGRYTDYILSEEALMYAFEQGLSESIQDILDEYADRKFKDKLVWERFLKSKEITSEREVRIATEAALLGSALYHGLNPDTIIVSDAAKQFKILVHALCWVHEERHYRKFIALTESESILINGIQDMIWHLYELLKKYKETPTLILKAQIEMEFDGLFNCETESAAINALLKNTLSRKEGLLRVLDHPHIPLHNNDSERDIREYVKRRKISGGTKSDLGRKARDTFTSLRKTCKKLNICFWDYLRDRIGRLNNIKPLAELIIKKARAIPIPT